MTLHLSIEEVCVIEDALDDFIVDQDEYLDVLDDLHYDGLYVSEYEYEDVAESIVVAEGVLAQIDDLFYEQEMYIDPFDDWYDDISDELWDDIVDADYIEEFTDAAVS